MPTYTPSTESELAQVIASLAQPVQILGGGTRNVAPNSDIDTLSMAGISGIVDYEPGALTMVARAGTPLTEIEQILSENSQQLAFEPAQMAPIMGRTGISTIGGVFATNASGPRRIQSGAARDFLLGVRFIDGTGTVLKNGGRVMKNVTGYDLVKLMAGSWGQLGAITEVAFKVLPIAEQTATVVVHTSNAAHATDVMTDALQTPFDVTGAAFVPNEGAVYIRIEGFEKSVTYRRDALVARFGKAYETSLLDHEASLSKWSNIRDFRPLQTATGDLWRISVKPTDGAKVVDVIDPRAAILDWSGGLVWAIVASGQDVRAAMSHLDGHAMCFAPSFAQFHPQSPILERTTRAIRDKFDPNARFHSEA